MAITKNKIQLRDKLFSVEDELEYYWSEFDYDYYDYDYRFWDCNCEMCSPVYEYLPKEKESDLLYLFGRIGTRRFYFGAQPKLGRMIDMKSIYSKEILRQKRIDFFLGLNTYDDKPTLGDIINKK